MFINLGLCNVQMASHCFPPVGPVHTIVISTPWVTLSTAATEDANQYAYIQCAFPLHVSGTNLLLGKNGNVV